MVSKKQRIAERMFGHKDTVTNKDAAETIGVGTAGTEPYMKPLGFIAKWQKARDVTGQLYDVKVWVQ